MSLGFWGQATDDGFDPPWSTDSRPMKTNDSDQLGSVSAQVGMKNPGPGLGCGLGAGKRHAQRAAGPGRLAPWVATSFGPKA
jgi:hypothetical protein